MLQKVEDKSIDVNILNRPCNEMTYRGVSQMFISKQVYTNRKTLYIGDGTKGK